MHYATPGDTIARHTDGYACLRIGERKWQRKVKIEKVDPRRGNLECIKPSVNSCSAVLEKIDRNTRDDASTAVALHDFHAGCWFGICVDGEDRGEVKQHLKGSSYLLFVDG